MNASSEPVWGRMVLLIGWVYFVVGYVFAKFAGMAASNQSNREGGGSGLQFAILNQPAVNRSQQGKSKS